jgi:hypothetical protein
METCYLPATHRFATQSAYQPTYHVAKSENRPSHQSDNPPAHHVIATQSDNPPTHHIATQSSKLHSTCVTYKLQELDNH